MKVKLRIFLLPILFLIFSSQTIPQNHFAVSYSDKLDKESLDGRLLVLISTDSTAEPRFQIKDTYKSQQMFGVDIDGFKSGENAIVDSKAFGYPLESLSDIPTGEYWVNKK